MKKNELLHMAAEQVGKRTRDGRMNGKAWLVLAVLVVLVVVGFFAYRLIVLEFITTMTDG